MPLFVKSHFGAAAGLAAGVLLGGFAAVPDRAWPGIQALIPPCIGQTFFRDFDFYPKQSALKAALISKASKNISKHRSYSTALAGANE